MKTLLILAILTLLIVGCTTTYNHPTKSASEFEQDRAECEQTVKQAMAAQGIDSC